MPQFKQTPTSTIAVILARGPSIAHYKPIPNATTYGVNDIFTYHPVRHLITLDNPYQAEAQSTYTPELAPRIAEIKKSTPVFWHYWKTTNAVGLEDYPGFTYTPLTKELYTGNNLFGELCPRWYSSAFVAAALAARHGHTTIITYGIDWHGHPDQAPKIPWLQKGWQMLAAEMATHGITLFCGHKSSYLSTFLPVYQP